MKQKCFEETLSYVYVIEFQKRIPNTPLLLTLKYNCKISTPEVVNRYIRYEELVTFAILSAINFDVKEINERVTELLDKMSERIYTRVDSIKNCDNREIDECFLPENFNTLNPANLPPHE